MGSRVTQGNAGLRGRERRELVTNAFRRHCLLRTEDAGVINASRRHDRKTQNDKAARARTYKVTNALRRHGRENGTARHAEAMGDRRK